MLLVMPLSVDLSFAGNNTPESKLGIVCTPSWTLNTKKLEETSEPHFIAVCNSLVPISLLRIRLLVAKEKREVTVRIPEMKSLISRIIKCKHSIQLISSKKNSAPLFDVPNKKGTFT